MKKRGLLVKKMQLFYEDIEEKRPKNKKKKVANRSRISEKSNKKTEF